MNKTVLSQRIAANHGISARKARAILDDMLASIVDEVASGESVQFTGFGTFRSAKRQARTGKNPFNGAEYSVPEHLTPVFVPGAQFKEKVAESGK